MQICSATNQMDANHIRASVPSLSLNAVRDGCANNLQTIRFIDSCRHIAQHRLRQIVRRPFAVAAY